MRLYKEVAPTALLNSEEMRLYKEVAPTALLKSGAHADGLDWALKKKLTWEKMKRLLIH